MCRSAKTIPRLPGLGRQRGQALAEFVAIAVAIVPLFLLIPLIAKYQDLSHVTQMAARYVAFDAFARNDGASSWKPEAELADEVRRRFFGNADAPIKTGDVAGDFLAHQNLFWRGPRGEPLIENFNRDVSISFGSSNGASHGDGRVAASDVQSMPLHTAFTLKASGVYTANVTVALANLPTGLKFYEPFDNINLSISRSTSVVYDPWMAGNPDEVDLRVAASPVVFPAAELRVIGRSVDPFVTAIDWPGGERGPLLGVVPFSWQDVVPQDRLAAKAGMSGSGGSGAPNLPTMP